MKHVSSAAALAVIAGCCVAGGLVAWIATARAEPQVVSDLGAYKIQVDYYAPRDPRFKGLYERLQKRKVLEELGQFLAGVQWPTTFRLLMKQCPEAATPRPARG